MHSEVAVLDKRLAESWINRGRHVVLGRALRPFCLWHKFLLEFIDSPFVSGTQPPTLIDLELAVRVCRSRFDTPIESIFGRRGFAQKLWMLWLAKRYDAQAEGEKFRQYIHDFHAHPRFWQPAQAPDAFDGPMPETFSIACQLIHGGGWGAGVEAWAWEMPIGRAYWYASGFVKLAGGDLKFVAESDDELAAIARAGFEYRQRKRAWIEKHYPALRGAHTLPAGVLKEWMAYQSGLNSQS